MQAKLIPLIQGRSAKEYVPSPKRQAMPQSSEDGICGCNSIASGSSRREAGLVSKQLVIY